MVMDIRSGGSGASFITCVRAKPGEPVGQNQAEYDRYKAFVEADPRVAEFVAWVRGLWPNSDVYVSANQCARWWTPGDRANVSLSFQLRHPDGSNMLSYAGGGTNIATALKQARYSIEDFSAEKVSKCIARALGCDPQPFGWALRPYHADAYTDEPEAPGEFTTTGETN